MVVEKSIERYSLSGKSINCYGLSIVERGLRRYGIEVNEFTIKSQNPILFSLYWPEQIYPFIKWRYQDGMQGRRICVGGNSATTNPAALLPFADKVYLGDGDFWDGDWDAGTVSRDTSKPQSIVETGDIIPMIFEDIQVTRRAFCEISRGCKNKCLFCQYGWLKRYREVDLEDIKAVLKRSKTKSIRVFAADRFQHSQYSAIRELLEKHGICDTGSDVSVKFLLQHSDYLRFTPKVRVGIEGMSSRLRSLIGKPLSDDKLVEFCKMVVDAGIKCFDWYMIYGLPTEGEKDVLLFKQLLDRLQAELPAGYTIAIHWNAFTPSAMTPFQWEASAYHYDTRPMQELLFSVPRGRITLMHKPKFTSKRTLLARMLAIRATEECGALLYSVAKNPRWLVKNSEAIMRKYKDIVGIDLHETWPIEKSLPWDKYVKYPKEQMFAVRNKAFRDKDVE